MWSIKSKVGISWDGEGIHRSEEVRTFLREGGAERIELVRLPGYAPELNPVKGVWSYMKIGSFLSNFACHDLAQLMNLLASAAGTLQSQLALVRAFFGQAGCY